MTIKDKYPWPEIKPNAPPINHTWFGHEQEALFNKFVSSSLQVIVELGTWMGGSSRKFYELCPNAQIYTIDNYSNFTDFNPCAIDWRLEKYLDNLRDIFFSINWEYRDRVTQLNETTQDGMNILKMEGIEAELVYVDGGHDFDHCYSDICLACACWPNAQIIGDDYDLPGVRKAVDIYAKDEKLTVDVYNNKVWAFV